MVWTHHFVVFVVSGTGHLSENASLWTNDRQLVAIVQSNFENLLHASQDWKSIDSSPTAKTARLLDRLKPSDHAIFVYDSRQTKHNFLFRYIQQGLEKNEAATYVCSEEQPNKFEML